MYPDPSAPAAGTSRGAFRLTRPPGLRTIVPLGSRPDTDGGRGHEARVDHDRDPGGAPHGGAAGGGSAGSRERRQGAALRRTGLLPAQGDRPLGRGAPLLRPGARVPLRVQPGGGAPGLRRGGAHRARLRHGPLGRGDGLRAAHQLPAGDAGGGRDGVEGSRPRPRPRGERHAGRARADRGGRRALRREAAREPGPARQRLRRCDARGVEGPPEGPRRRGASSPRR